MDKKKLSETDICAKFITPALDAEGWGEAVQIYGEYTLCPGATQQTQTRRAVALVAQAIAD